MKGSCIPATSTESSATTIVIVITSTSHRRRATTPEITAAHPATPEAHTHVQTTCHKPVITIFTSIIKASRCRLSWFPDLSFLPPFVLKIDFWRCSGIGFHGPDDLPVRHSSLSTNCKSRWWVDRSTAIKKHIQQYILGHFQKLIHTILTANNVCSFWCVNEFLFYVFVC